LFLGQQLEYQAALMFIGVDQLSIELDVFLTDEPFHGLSVTDYPVPGAACVIHVGAAVQNCSRAHRRFPSGQKAGVLEAKQQYCDQNMIKRAFAISH
jgi:hypothetical protein